MTVLLALNSSSDMYCMMRTLTALQPRYILLYDVDVSYVRQIEVCLSPNPGLLGI